MFKKLKKGYRNSINSRLRNFTNNFNHPIHHRRRSNPNEVNTYYFVASLSKSKSNKIFITAYNFHNFSINQIRSKCASNMGRLVDVKMLLPKDVQNYSWELQDKLKDIPFGDIKGVEWKEYELGDET